MPGQISADEFDDNTVLITSSWMDHPDTQCKVVA